MGTKTRTLTLAISGEDKGISKPFDKAAKEGDKLADKLKGSGDKAGKGLSDGVEDGVDKLGAKLKAGGQKAGEALNSGVKAGTDKLGSTLESAGSTSADLFSGGFDIGGIADAISGKIGDLGSKGGKLLAGVAAVGVAAGAAFTVGLLQGMENEVATDKLAAQLGGSEWAQSQGEVAGNLYLAGWGESIAETGEAVKLIHQNGLLPEDATNRQIEDLGGLLLTFTDVLVQDMDMTTQAVSNMIRSGIADSSEEALDIMTRGIQQGADRAGDLAETFQEYSTMFRDAGLSAADATGLMVQGLNEGARDADTVADSLKEFAIRAQDGSEASAAGFKAIGLNAADMTAAVAAGGPAARDALDQVLDGLRNMEDPAARNAAAVGLFGTKAEDLGDALFSLDLDTAAGSLGNVAGSTDKLNAAYDNASSTIETFKRQRLQDLTTFIGNEVIPAAQDLAKTYGDDLGRGFETAGQFIEDHKGVVQGLGAVVATVAGLMILSWAATTAAAAGAAIKAGAEIVFQILKYVALGAAATAYGIAAAAAWLVSIAPIVLVGLAIAGLVALVVIHFDTIKNAIATAFNWVKQNWPLLLAVLTGPFGLAVLAIVKNWDTIKGAASAVFNWLKSNWPLVLAILTGPFGLAVLFIKRNWDSIVSFITGLPGRITSAASGMWDGIKNSFRTMLNAIIGWWNRLSFTLPEIHIPGFDPPGPGPSFGGVTLGGQTFSTPNIPTLHEGGTYRAPTPGGEGLAMLLDGEVVSEPGQTSTTSELHIHLHGPVYGVDNLYDTVNKGIETGRINNRGRRI